jgi:hypothetical protein
MMPTGTALVRHEPAPIDRRLDECADRIRTLMSNIAVNAIALGGELAKAKQRFKALPKKMRPQKNWEAWVQAEFHISVSWASVMIRAAGTAKAHGGTAHIKKHSPNVLALLTAKPSKALPQSALTEIKERIDKGEHVSRDKARAITRKHRKPTEQKMPSPTEAKDIAVKHGIIVAASDGRLYTGASDEAIRAIDDQRTVVYSVREAIATIANLKAMPEEFMKLMSPHQRWTRDEEWMIEEAHLWLCELHQRWKYESTEAERREKIREIIYAVKEVA